MVCACESSQALLYRPALYQKHVAPISTCSVNISKEKTHMASSRGGEEHMIPIHKSSIGPRKMKCSVHQSRKKASPRNWTIFLWLKPDVFSCEWAALIRAFTASMRGWNLSTRCCITKLP